MLRVVLLFVTSAVVQHLEGANLQGAAYENNKLVVDRLCAIHHCPQATVKDKAEDYELREFDDSTWVGTSVSAGDYDAAKPELYSALTEYISGANEDNLKIPMALPIVSLYQFDKSHLAVKNFSMWFYISGPKAPAPTNPDVSIEHFGKVSFFVGEYSGGPETVADREEHAKTLALALKRDHRAFDPDVFHILTYEDPTKTSESHHEVSMLAL